MNRAEDGHEYSDPEGHRTYAERDEWEICIERNVPASAERAWEAWYPSIWEGQDGTVMRNPGEGRGRLGSVRRIPRVRLTESIVSVGLPAPFGISEVVPSISYTVEHFSATSYLGYVRFVPIDNERRATRVIWCVKWTPSLSGRLFFFGGHLLARMLRSAMQQALTRLESEAIGSTATH